MKSVKWIKKECAPYQMSDGTLIPVNYYYPEYITVIVEEEKFTK